MKAISRPSQRWPRTIKERSVSIKIYRNKSATNRNGWEFVVAWKSTTGRQRVKFSSEAAAISEARIKAAQLAAGRVEGAEMTLSDRDELQAARQKAGSVPLLAALEEWAKARELSSGAVIPAAEAWAARNGPGITSVTVETALKEYLRAKTKAGKNIATDHASAFTSIREDLGNLPMPSVSTKQLDAWLVKRENPVTRNTYRKRIVALWRWAQMKGYLVRDARTEAEMTDRAHEPAPEIGIISVQTFAGLLAAVAGQRPELLPSLVIAGFCGLRRAEIHAQKWEDISLEQKHLRVTNVKRGTAARRLVPLCDAAVQWLLLSGDRKGLICENLAIDQIRKFAREAQPVIGIPENAFRHSYISYKVAATGDIARVSLEAGNSPKEINRHYRELVTEAEGKAWFALIPQIPVKIVHITNG